MIEDFQDQEVHWVHLDQLDSEVFQAHQVKMDLLENLA